jgi:hypothetical protein
MKNEKQTQKRKRGGQPGNQNARTHGRYSHIASPREIEVLEAVATLDDHGRRLVFKWLMTQLLGSEFVSLLKSGSFSPVPEKPERMPESPDFDAEFSAWMKEQNISMDEIMREAFKTNRA